MGLDSFWEMPKGKTHPKFDPPLKICGGLFSDPAQGSFRGKVYNMDIENITGVSLYQEKIPNKVIKKMAKALEGSVSEYVLLDEEWEHVIRMFRVYADAGADLIGWW